MPLKNVNFWRSHWWDYGRFRTSWTPPSVSGRSDGSCHASRELQSCSEACFRTRCPEVWTILYKFQKCERFSTILCFSQSPKRNEKLKIVENRSHFWNLSRIVHTSEICHFLLFFNFFHFFSTFVLELPWPSWSVRDHPERTIKPPKNPDSQPNLGISYQKARVYGHQTGQ